MHPLTGYISYINNALMSHEKVCDALCSVILIYKIKWITSITKRGVGWGVKIYYPGAKMSLFIRAYVKVSQIMC